MKLFVVRHGETDWNVKKILQGRADIPLNEKGKEQAKHTRELLKNTHIDAVFSSPLKRARETAEIITEGRGLEIHNDDRLLERDFGEYEGVDKTTFAYADLWAYEKNIQYKKAENIRDFFKRIYGFLDEIKAKYPDGSVMIVTHGGVTKIVRCYAEGMVPDDEIAAFLVGNAGYSEYEI